MQLWLVEASDLNGVSSLIGLHVIVLKIGFTFSARAELV